MKNKTRKRIQAKRILSVKVKTMSDLDPDTSYLEQEGFEDRLRQYQNDAFSYIGIRAEAEVTVHTFSHGALITQTITSGGLWNIESDSDIDYIKSVEQDELASLKSELKALGFSSRAISQAFKSIKEVSE